MYPGISVSKNGGVKRKKYIKIKLQDHFITLIPVQGLFFSVSVNDADFKAGVTSLSMILQIPPHTDHLKQLKVRRWIMFSEVC